MCGINYLRSEAKWGFWAAREEVSCDQLQGQRPDGIGGSIGDELIRVNHLRGMQIRTEKRDHPVLRIGFPDEGSTTSDDTCRCAMTPMAGLCPRRETQRR